MTSPSASSEGTAREAAERNAAAVMAGNLAQVMSDITPDALAQMMQMAGAAGGMSPAAMPNIESYEVVEQPPADAGEVFHVTFVSASGRATIATTWALVMGQWKITAVSLVSVEPAPPA